MRTLQRALLVFVLAPVPGHIAWAQSNQSNGNLSAGSGGAYDASVCNDPTIAINAQQQNATPYRDATPTGQPDPLAAALYDLAQKYDLPFINRAGVCLHASGVVFMVPTDRVGELTQLIGEIDASQPRGDTYSSGDNNGSPGQPGGTPTTGGGATPNPAPVTGGPPANYSPMPGPAGGIGYVPGPNPRIAGGGYNYCNNGPGARLPPGCICNNPAPLPPPPPPPAGQPLQGNLTATRMYGTGTTSVLGNKNGKTVTMKIPLNIDLGAGFPRQGMGTLVQGPVWNSATGWEPDPNIVKFDGSLNPSGTIFTIKTIYFTPGAKSTYGVGDSYTFPAGKQPAVNLSPYQSNVS